MHISRSDLNLLVVFEAIYTQGGVTKAAKILHLTQPTISHSLARLRERVGDPLFIRHGQKLVPTPMAHRMISPIRESLQTIEKTLAALDEFDPESADISFSIGMRALMENAYYLPLASRVMKETQNVSIAAEYFERRHLEADLSSGRLNAAIDIFVPLPEVIQKQHLTSANQVIVARKDHPILSQKLTLEDYLNQKHIVVTSRPNGLGPEDVALARTGERRNIVMRCQQINTALRMVAQSDLLLTMADSYATRAYAIQDSELLPLPFSCPAVDIYLYWHINSDSDPANTWLRKLIYETCLS